LTHSGAANGRSVVITHQNIGCEMEGAAAAAAKLQQKASTKYLL